MKYLSLGSLITLSLCVVCLDTQAATHYVNKNSISPIAPYTSWATAAVAIQDAVDVALPGSTVLVTNGVYETGATSVLGYPNRIAINRPINVRSVNGSEVTTIRGQILDEGVADARRCVYMVSGSSLSGFTLTDGDARTYDSEILIEISGGGLFCESGAVVSNCVVTGNYAERGGGSYGGVLYNCVLTNNYADAGGGSFGSDLKNCTINGNSSGYGGGGVSGGTLSDCILIGNFAGTVYRGKGGGAANCVLKDCIVKGNSTSHDGGGVMSSTLDNCLVVGNTTRFDGGGASDCIMNNCIVLRNSAEYGGGTYYSTVNNSTLSGNTASQHGGGADGGTLIHCTISDNTAATGGGVLEATVKNSIVYYNTAHTGPNVYSSTVQYSCTSPDPGGIGNITNVPQLVGPSHISSFSPCVGAGNEVFSSGFDIDGDPWQNPPSMGCDEPTVSSVTGELSVAISATYTTVTPGVTVDFSGHIDGHPSLSIWNFGDGTIILNQPWVSHSWNAVGDYDVVLTVYNSTYPFGVSATVVVQVVERITRYVDLNNSMPVSPYTSWETAATNVQHAIDVAWSGDLVLVSNGVYKTGYTLVSNVPHRVAITKPISVQSVNGSEVTIIDGEGVDDPEGEFSSLRCVYMASNTFLSGFSLTNGFADFEINGYEIDTGGGGVFCEGGATVSNCVLTGNYADYGGGSYGGTLNNCELIGNASGYIGGGAVDSTLNYCLIEDNYAGLEYRGWGGGVHGCDLNGCTIKDNQSGFDGGGAYRSTLNNCTVIDNTTEYYGGGAADSVLNNCMVLRNSALEGGGADSSILNNSTLSENSASYSGGGAQYGTLNHCTLTGNSGGGVSEATVNNSIVYYNTEPNVSGGSIQYSCMPPDPDGDPGGVGNITNAPMLTGPSHISWLSPCVGMGNAAFSNGTDIDGDLWNNPPSMGCDEPNAGSVTGELSVAITASYIRVNLGFTVNFVGHIEGRPSLSVWDFGDGMGAVNQPWISHAWSDAGVYDVVLTVYNSTHPFGLSATVQVHVTEHTLYYVNLNNPTPVYPYVTWEQAAVSIQDAVDAATPGSFVWVTNGTYKTGGVIVTGEVTNRIAVTKPLTVQSVNGPELTIIEGSGPQPNAAVRCVYLSSEAVLTGFTLTRGQTKLSYKDDEGTGGGVWCEGVATINHCILNGNTAFEYGGGAYRGTLNNCLLINNRASRGGGAVSSVLNNSTLVKNSATTRAGGIYVGSLMNCIVYNNTAPVSPNYDSTLILYSCTTPDPGRVGNITNEPLFVSVGDYRLQYNSPCIDAGMDLSPIITNDLDGLARPMDGDLDGISAFDMGAYEFIPDLNDTDGDTMPDGWETAFSLNPINADDAAIDSDNDGVRNRDEWIANTDPSDSNSWFRIINISSTTERVVYFPSSDSRVYTLEWTRDLQDQHAWTNVPNQTGILGVGGMDSMIDSNESLDPIYYRIKPTLP